jgi:short chain dehydrogenase
MTITDKDVLVTGANRGIGQALVEEALRRGAKRVYSGTRQPLAHIDGRVKSLTLDVTNAEQIQSAVNRVESLDVLRRASASSISCSTGFSLQSVDTPAPARHSFIRGFYSAIPATSLPSVIEQESTMGRTLTTAVECRGRRPYLCHSRVPAKRCLSFS